MDAGMQGCRHTKRSGLRDAERSAAAGRAAGMEAGGTDRQDRDRAWRQPGARIEGETPWRTEQERCEGKKWPWGSRTESKEGAGTAQGKRGDWRKKNRASLEGSRGDAETDRGKAAGSLGNGEQQTLEGGIWERHGTGMGEMGTTGRLKRAQQIQVRMYWQG